MNRWCIGDIHGEDKKLIRLLKKINFNYEEDQLIQLGDVVDRGAGSFEVVEELLKIKNLIAIRGNHDDCFRDSIITGRNLLYSQGGRETLLSYTRSTDCDNDPTKIPEKHKDFYINKQIDYYIDENNNLYVHGGFDRHQYIKEQESQTLMWDRDLILSAIAFDKMKSEYKFKTKDNFNKVFLGHTPTIYWGEEEFNQNYKDGSIINADVLEERMTKPINVGNGLIWNLDTGCGKGDFPLTAMNIDTEEYIQEK